MALKFYANKLLTRCDNFPQKGESKHTQFNKLGTIPGDFSDNSSMFFVLASMHCSDFFQFRIKRETTVIIHS